MCDHTTCGAGNAAVLSNGTSISTPVLRTLRNNAGWVVFVYRGPLRSDR